MAKILVVGAAVAVILLVVITAIHTLTDQDVHVGRLVREEQRATRQVRQARRQAAETVKKLQAEIAVTESFLDNVEREVIRLESQCDSP